MLSARLEWREMLCRECWFSPRCWDWRGGHLWTELLLGHSSAAFLLENQLDWSQFYAVEMDWTGLEPVPARKVVRTEDPCPGLPPSLPGYLASQTVT